MYDRRMHTYEVTFRTGTVVVRARRVGEAVAIARAKLGARLEDFLGCREP